MCIISEFIMIYLQAQEFKYISLAMRETDSSACVTSISLELTTPNIVYCIHKCLSMGYDCKAVTYVAPAGTCQISDDKTTGSCSVSGAKSYEATGRVPFTTTTTTTSATPTNLVSGE